MSGTRPIRILYMEDDQGLARLVQKKLEKAGYSIDIAYDGEEGLAKYSLGSYDVLLVDQTMPFYDGLEVIRILGSRGPLPPSIMITGSGNEKLAVEAMKLGAKDYIVKDMEFGFLELLPTVIKQAIFNAHLADQKKRAVEALRESEKKYHTLFELASDAFLTAIPPEEKILDGNVAAVKMLGYSKEELRRLTVWQIFAPETIEEARCKWRTQLLNTGYSFMETMWVRKDGSILPVAVSGGSFKLEGGVQFQLIGHDITEYKKAEEKREKLIKELKDALSKVKTLSGLLPICSKCKKIRDDKGYWHQIETYIRNHSEAEFTHGLCYECAKELYPEKYHKMFQYD